MQLCYFYAKWVLKLIAKKFDIFPVNGIQLTPLDYRLNLDIAKLVRDKKTYHLFHDAYIKDEKLRYFRIMYILLQIYEYAKGREIKVLIVMEEIRNFLKKSSEKAEGWKKVLSDTVSDLISKVASMGIIIVATTQVITDLDSGIQQILPQFLIGKTASSKDARMIQLNWSIEAKEAVHALRKGEFMIMRNSPSGGVLVPKKIVIPVSAHCHPERHLNFERLWKKHYPQRVSSYRELRNTYRDDIRAWNAAYTKKVKVELRKQRKKEQIKKEAMEAKQLKKEGVEQSKMTLAESSKQMQEQSKQHVIMECMTMQNTLGKVIFNQIAKNNGVHAQTVKKWWLAHQEESNTPAKPVSDKGIEILD